MCIRRMRLLVKGSKEGVMRTRRVEWRFGGSYTSDGLKWVCDGLEVHVICWAASGAAKAIGKSHLVFVICSLEET